MNTAETRKVVIGITGASGAPYAKRLIAALQSHQKVNPSLQLACVISATSPQVWALECGGHPKDMGIPLWVGRDYGAPFASGSAQWDSMVIVPCSMGTAGRIAHGISESLLTRAADVMLKERRRLILVPRETPMSTIHLENLAHLAKAGALILPACPSFYSAPRTLDDLIDTVVARILDHLHLTHGLGARWGHSLPEVEHP